jgi:3'-phosphoadenosine 5'-phosphosulfate sulfotransferase (PAPS reductase)/FAD synthetase
MTHIASCSFGKDSLAMVLLLMERGYPLDEVMFYDTGMEFQAIYNIRDKMLPIFTQAGIKYTELRPQNSFLYDMLDRPVISKQKGSHLGYGWCGGVCRWGTTFKTQSLDAHADGAARHYVGIAADETDRLNRLVAPKCAPLAEVGMTESDCLAYCRAKGFSWGEGDVDLYDILDRVSCWCCENKNFKELKNIYCYLPKYWEKLKWMQARIERPMKKWRNKKYGAYGNVFDMERVFADGIMKEPDHAE